MVTLLFALLAVTVCSIRAEVKNEPQEQAQATKKQSCACVDCKCHLGDKSNCYCDGASCRCGK